MEQKTVLETSRAEQQERECRKPHDSYSFRSNSPKSKRASVGQD